MTTPHIQINGEVLVPTANIRRIRIVTDDDRASLASLGNHVDPEKFHTRLQYADGSKTYAIETIDEIAAKGADPVQNAEGAFVPGQNIKSARNVTPDDRRDFEARLGRPMRDDFKSQVETRAGLVLATVAADTVMRRLGQPYQPVKSTETQEQTMAP